ncbi:IS110 family transposase [Bacillus piscicola]|uniref:IS110 family transposase n=1 Tax=Bacillus piscicola TaxID=1632684 RepID=UPI001F091F5A|nr:IS110 family transposase [Bacillus piscicola]
MHHNRNFRIDQVDEQTLVVGVDIAKENHYACAVDERGRELGRSWKLKQSRQGFETFYATLTKLAESHGKDQLLIGFEPTGHYWMNLAGFLALCEIPFVLVNPHHVKKSKELDDNLPSKNDKKDARLIAKMITYGHYSIPREQTAIDAELRKGAAFRTRLRKDHSSIQNRIRRWLDLYFPEFQSVYKGIGKQACAILKDTPLPADLLASSPEAIIQAHREAGNQYLPQKKVEQLMQKAEHSIGIQEGSEVARMEINMLISQLEMIQSQIETLTERLIALAKEIQDFDCITSVEGLSDTFAVELLAETGPLTNYEHPRQTLKLAGLTLRTHSSGTFEGDKRISKRGRKSLRALLYRAVVPLMHANKAFKALYDYYISRRENPLTGKEALVVLSRKLLQICHGLCKHGRRFDVEHMMRDMPFLVENKAA